MFLHIAAGGCGASLNRVPDANRDAREGINNIRVLSESECYGCCTNSCGGWQCARDYYGTVVVRGYRSANPTD